MRGLVLGIGLEFSPAAAASSAPANAITNPDTGAAITNPDTGQPITNPDT